MLHFVGLTYVSSSRGDSGGAAVVSTWNGYSGGSVSPPREPTQTRGGSVCSSSLAKLSEAVSAHQSPAGTEVIQADRPGLKP